MTTQRRYDIDWLRVIAIALLLIYHVTIIFQPWALFIGFIKSDASLESLWLPMSMLNVWRIPFLFYVSGMGLYFAMRKRNWKQLLQERFLRIGIPFMVGYLAITPLHFIVFQYYYEMPLSYHPSSGHLWFLGNILVYVLILLPLFYYLQKNPQGKFQYYISKLMSFAFGPLSITLLFVLEILWVKPPLFELYAHTWHGFFIGLLAFFFGFLLVYSGNSFWKTVSRWKWLYVSIAIVLFALRIYPVEGSAMFALKAVESNCWIFVVFGWGYQYLNKSSKILSYLSEAAYPVYILHMVIMYAAAAIILPTAVHPVLQLIAITIFTFGGCFLVYEFLLKRIAWIRPLVGLSQKTQSKGIYPVEQLKQ